MTDSFERLICKDKGKYLEIGFTSGIFSLITYVPLIFLAKKFFGVEERITKEIIFSPASAITFHISFTTVYAFLIGLKNDISTNKFLMLTIAIGVLGEVFYPVKFSIFIFILILSLSWFVYAVVFLALEKKIATDTNEAFEEKLKKENKDKEEDNQKNKKS